MNGGGNRWHLVLALAVVGVMTLGGAGNLLRVSAPSPPEVAVTYPVQGQTVNGITVIEGLAGDDAGVVSVQVAFDDNAEWYEAQDTSEGNDWSTWAYEWNTTPFSNGWHVILARAFDGAEYSVIFDVHVIVENPLNENNPPEVWIVYPEDWSEVSGIVVVKGHAVDPDEGDVVELVQVAIDNTEDWINATDTSGNDTWWTWEYEWNTTEIEDGWHYIVARAYDGELYSPLSDAHYFVNNDNEPPHCKIVEPGNEETVSGTIPVWVKAWDDYKVKKVFMRIDDGDWLEMEYRGKEGDYSYWERDWDTTEVEDGWHHIHARAWDGHEHSQVDTIIVRVRNEENHAPWVEIFHPLEGEVVSGIYLIHGLAGDPDDWDKVESVYVRIDEGDWVKAVDLSQEGTWSTWAYHWNTFDYTNGTHIISAIACDGELQSDKAFREVVVHNQNTKPEVEIVHPESGKVVRGLYVIHGKAWDPDEGDRIRGVAIKIDDGEWQEAKDTSPDDSWYTWAYEWNTELWDDHCYHIYAKSWDGELWSKEDQTLACVDNVDDPPTVEITYPIDGEVLEGIVLVQGTASDDRGVEIVQVRIDEGEWNNAVDLSGDWHVWAYEWRTAEYPNGNHTIFARAWDGNQYSELDFVAVFVRNLNHAPVVDIVYPEDGDIVDGEVLIHGTASDPDEGDKVELVQVRIDNGTWMNATDTSADGSWSTWAYLWNTTKVKNGNHTIFARSWDGDLWSALDNVTVTVYNAERSAPPISPYVMIPIVGGGLAILAAVIILIMRKFPILSGKR